MATRLIEAGHGIVLVGGPTDAWVRESFAGLPVLDLVGQTSLKQLPAVFGCVDAVVSHDTSAAHLARWVETPVVALFGPTSPHEKIFPDGASRVLWGGESLPCRPCYDGRDFSDCTRPRCMEDISVDAVMAAVAAVVAKRRHPAAAPILT